MYKFWYFYFLTYVNVENIAILVESVSDTILKSLGCTEKK